MNESQQPRRRREIKTHETVAQQHRRRQLEESRQQAQQSGSYGAAVPVSSPAPAEPVRRRARPARNRPVEHPQAQRIATERQSRRRQSAQPAFSSDSELTPAPLWMAVSRAVALFLGSFVVLNLAGELRSPGFDANQWWLDLRVIPEQFATGILALQGVGLLLFAFRPNLPGMIKAVVVLVLLCSTGFAVYNSLMYYQLLRAEAIQSTFPVPFSLQVIAMLLVVLVGVLNGSKYEAGSVRNVAGGLFAFVLCLLVFPLAQMYCYGKTDYRRNADMILVFGCRAHADGTASDALTDRMTTACQLYQEGLAPKVVLSGGPGDGEFHETAVMKKLALEKGVPESAIVIDEKGWNTAQTVNNLQSLIAEGSEQQVLAVSHFYHLPRIKMASQRKGMNFLTVPAEESMMLRHQPWFLFREAAAMWWYYFEPLTQGS